MAAENVESDAAQGKDIQAGPLGGVGPCGFRGQIQQAQILDVVLNVLGPGRAVDGVGRTGAADVAGGGLPVHEPQLHGAAVQAMDRDALRPEGTVVQALGVGVLQGLCDVADHLQALRDREGLHFDRP